MGQTCSELARQKEIALPDLTPDADWQQREYLRAHDVRTGKYGALSQPSASPYQAFTSYQPSGEYSSSKTDPYRYIGPGSMNSVSTPATVTDTKLSSQLAQRQNQYRPDFTWQQDAYLLAHNAELRGESTAHNRIVNWNARTMEKWRTDPFYEWRDDPEEAPDYIRNRRTAVARKDWCWQYPDRQDQKQILTVQRTLPTLIPDHPEPERPKNRDDQASSPKSATSPQSQAGNHDDWKKPRLVQEKLLSAGAMPDPTRDQRRIGPEGLPPPMVTHTEMKPDYSSDARLEKNTEGHKERLLAGPPGCFIRR